MHYISSLIFIICMSFAVIVSAGALVEEDAQKREMAGLVTLSLQSDSVEIGDRMYLSGTIDQSLYGTNPSDVVILISSPKGSRADTFMLARPAGNGTFRYNQVADVGGEWGFEALYSGIYSERVNIYAEPGSEPKRTALTMSGWPTFPKIGEHVSFNGRLTDGEGKGIPNKQIVYRLASSPVSCIAGCGFGESMSTWRDAGSATTDINGDYHFSLTVVEKGSVQVEASYTGEEGYSPSSSRILKITVYE